MIEIENLSKRYGDFIALQDVSLTIPQGEIVGLLGPNGAGKTTLIRAITGYFEPSAGEIRIDGRDVVADPNGVQEIIGYLPEQTPLYPEMLVQEYLDMAADLRGLPKGGARLRMLAEAIWATELEHHLTRPIGALSKGFRQRVCLAQAILHRPKVLILDEPTSGLDPSQVVHVRDLIRRLAHSTTVVFSTHILSEVEQVCERAVILLGGKVQLDQRLDDIRAAQGLHVTLAGDAGAAQGKLAALPGIQEVRATETRGDLVSFELRGAADPESCRRIFRLARDQGWELAELRAGHGDLESVFRDLVAHHEASPPPLASTPSTEEVRA